jgi:nitroreductase
MNEILESLYQRKSVRVYEPRPVPAQVKEQLLEAAAQAPTACNQQRYTILDITDLGIKARLAETCDNQSFIAQAPVVLIFCADNRRWLDAFEAAECDPRRPGPADLTLAITDAVIAAQNTVVAAESLGLGSCYIGNILARNEEHRALLHLPEYVFPAAMLVLGYPTAQQLARPKPPRFPTRALVCENTYRPDPAQEWHSLFSCKAGARQTGDWLRSFCARMYQSEFCRGMNRSVEEYWEEYMGKSAKKEEENT